MKLLVWIVAALWLAAAPADAGEIAIVHARIYVSPDAPPIEDGSIVVRDGRITAVGPAARVRPGRQAQVIDGRGLVVTAGFWNSHVHLLAPPFQQTAPPGAAGPALEALFTRWGFTTVFDIASFPGDAIALRRRIAAGEVKGPNVLTVDAPFYPRDGIPIYARELLAGRPSFEVGTPAQGAERARRQLAAGADGVKLFAGSIVGPPIGVLPMPLDQARAVVDAARRAGKPAFAHPSNRAGLEVAMAAGVDVLAHTAPEDGPWPAGTARRLVEKKMALIPTLYLFQVELEKDGAPPASVDRMLEVVRGQLRDFAAAGGQVLFGTDVGYIEDADTTREYRLMAGAGLSWRQILASLTTAPAERFKARRKGRLVRGMDGDITVLAADPAQDVAAFAKVAYTIRGGEIIYSAR